jgi:hypothetical protein
MKYLLSGGPRDGETVEFNYPVPVLIFVESSQPVTVLPDYYIEHVYETGVDCKQDVLAKFVETRQKHFRNNRKFNGSCT